MQVKQFVIKALKAFAIVGLLMCLSCGKRKPPQPPKEKVLQRADVTGFQRGNKVILSWKMPIRNAPPGSVLHISRADIYRLAEPLTDPQSLSEAEFADRSTIVAAFPVDDSDFGAKTLQYIDTLQFAGQPVRLRYAVRFVNASGQKAAFSNFFLLEPAAAIASAPTSLSAAPSQDVIQLSWHAPTANINGTTPANIIGYNIYRSESQKVPAKLLNEVPVTGTTYNDGFFAFESQYLYFVRTVSLGTGGENVESSESQIVEIKPVDKFAPSAPASVTIAATPTSISIFFPSNPEKDIAGYLIYRSSDQNLPKTEWKKMTDSLLPTNTFKDDSVSPGATYFYFVTATDKFGNVSEPSEVVSEKVPS